MRYELLEPYLSTKYIEEISASKETLCDMFDEVNIPMDNYTWCEVHLYKRVFQISASSAAPGNYGRRYSFIFYEDKVVAERNYGSDCERIEIPYISTEEELFQLSTVYDTAGLDLDILRTMSKIRVLYV